MKMSFRGASYIVAALDDTRLVAIVFVTMFIYQFSYQIVHVNSPKQEISKGAETTKIIQWIVSHVWP